MKRKAPATTRLQVLVVIAVILLTGGCSKPSPESEAVSTTTANRADSIYFGGPIIALDDAQPSVEAVAVKGGKIVAVGTRADIEKVQKGEKTKLVAYADLSAMGDDAIKEGVSIYQVPR